MCGRLEVKSETTGMAGSHLTWTLGFILSEMGAAGGFAVMDQILVVARPTRGQCLAISP